MLFDIEASFGVLPILGFRLVGLLMLGPGMVNRREVLLALVIAFDRFHRLRFVHTPRVANGH